MPVAWRLLLGLAAIKVVVHTLSNGPLAWGYMTDELYFLDSLDRLDWGFVDHPPLSVALLVPVRAVLGDSIFAVRLLAVLAGAGVVVLTGMMAAEMGGGRTAQGLAALMALVSPIHLSMTGYYSMNPLDQLVWAVVFLLVLRLLNGASQRWWLAIGAVLGMGLLNKVSVSWLAFGIVAGLLLTPERRWLRAPWPWLAGVIAAAAFAPFVWWQWSHGWPFAEFSRNAAELKVGEVSFLDFTLQQVVNAQVFAAPLWIGGLVYCFAAPAMRRYRMAAWAFVFVFLLLATSGSARPHYLGPAFSIAFAFGGVAAERLAERWQWLPRTFAVALAVSGLIALPIAIPTLSPAATMRYMDALSIHPPQEKEAGGELPMHLGLYLHPEAGLAAMTRAYQSLTPEERSNVVVITRSFGETGAVNVLGRSRGLPKSVGVHNQYWLWGPGAATADVVLITHDSEEELGRWFESCERRAEIDCPKCMQLFDAQSIFLCRHPRRPLAEIWPEMKIYR